MSVKLPGEQGFLSAPVALAPAQARQVSPDVVLQRLRYSQGRTLTQSAMGLEQSWAEARLGLWGRRLSAGVVEGLRVSVADQAADAGRFTIGGGRAIAPGGQDLVVHKARSLQIDDLVPLGAAAEAAGDPRGLIVVVLEPVVIEAENLPADVSALGAFEDPCPPDPAAGPYLDIVLQDATRASWVALDDTLAGLDPAFAPNIAAESLRQLEAAAPASLPWAAFGVPIVMMMVDPAGRILWHHHAAVVRRGGMLPQVQLTALDRVRQSRIEGLVEETAIATRNADWDGSSGHLFLRHLPPAGLLPRKAWDSRNFFPLTWGQAQAPIPRSQLDAAFESARALAPYDTALLRDRVKWLVPVPDHLYAPDLLEPPGPTDFDEVRTPLEARVADGLALRTAYRNQAQTVQGVIDASAVTDFSSVEDDPVAGEGGFATDDPATPVDFAAEASDALGGAHALLSDSLFTADQRDMLDPAAIAAPDLPYGITPFVTEMRALVDAANDTVDFAFNRVQTEIYRVRQIMLEEEEATKLATFPVLAGLAKGSSHFALSEGLRAQFQALTGTGTDGEESGGGTPSPSPTDGGGGSGPAPRSAPLSFPDARRAITSVGDASVATRLQGSTFLAGTGSALRLDLGGDFLLPGPTRGGAGTVFTGFGDSRATLSFGSILGNSDALLGTTQTAVKTLVDETRGGLIDDALLLDTQSKRTGILRAAPLPGDIRDTRSTTIADRLSASAALTAKASALRIKADVLREIQGLGISLVALDAPLTSARDVVLLLREEVEDAVASSNLSTAEQAILPSLRRDVADTGDGRDWEVVTLTAVEDTSDEGTVRVSGFTRLGSELRRRRAPIDMTLLPALALSKVLDPDPAVTPGDPVEADDEAAFLQSAIATLDSIVAILRAVEARLVAITSVVDEIASLTKTFDDIQTRWESALTLADQDLDEARHDLRVALSLIAEETARLQAVQTERERIIAEEVKYVAYIRPRALEAHRAGDTLGLLLPGAFEDPLPASLKRDVTLPPALESMISALREMPIGWFSANPELAADFAKPGYLEWLYGNAGFRANTKFAQFGSLPQPFAASGSAGAAPAFLATSQIVSGYQSLTQKVLQLRGAIDYGAYAKASWSERKRRALTDLSLNDLIEAGSHAKVAKRALEEIEQIERVLHAELQLFRQVPAPIRLIWVQQLSVFDKAKSLSSLVKLPSWGLIDWALRNKLIRLNDWLFARMEPGVAEARAIMSDMVRVAILLASHAPVAEIVTARIESDQTVSKGGAVDLVIRRGSPQIGMLIAVMDGGSVRGRGVLRDFSGAQARIEMTELDADLTILTPAFEVTVYQPQALALVGV